MIDFSDYENKKDNGLTFEQRDDFQRRKTNIHGERLTTDERDTKLRNLEEELKQARRDGKRAYQEETNRSLGEFRKDVEREMADWWDEPPPPGVWDQLHAFAWEHGHSGGYYEVFNMYGELVPMANKIVKATCDAIIHKAEKTNRKSKWDIDKEEERPEKAVEN
jgi:hypothetical protein